MIAGIPVKIEFSYIYNESSVWIPCLIRDIKITLNSEYICGFLHICSLSFCLAHFKMPKALPQRHNFQNPSAYSRLENRFIQASFYLTIKMPTIHLVFIHKCVLNIFIVAFTQNPFTFNFTPTAARNKISRGFASISFNVHAM